jgi:hypothetical protein
MTEADLIAETRKLEFEVRKTNQNTKRINLDNRQLEARIVENEKKLKQSC